MHRYTKRTLHAFGAGTIAAGGAYQAVMSVPGSDSLSAIGAATWLSIAIAGVIASAKYLVTPLQGEPSPPANPPDPGV